ncbi:MAG: T9SS type A sorting domain-containing protein, partial [Candidatus Zixiibacteriota bacterium]
PVGALILRGIISHPGYENAEIIYYGPQQTNVEAVCDIPGSFVSCRNYPNPFNASTVIFADGISGPDARLSIFDLLGRKIIELTPYDIREGSLFFKWDGLDNESGECPSGTYFYLIDDSYRKTSGKMVYLK